MDQINQVLEYYNQHKGQLLVMYLAIQTVLKAGNDALAANKDKKGLSKVFGVLYSFTLYLGIGKRA